MFRRSGLLCLLALEDARRMLGLGSSTAESSAPASPAGATRASPSAGAPPPPLLQTPPPVTPAAASSAKNPATEVELRQVLEILESHFESGDEALLEAALQALVKLDRTSVDSALMCLCRVTKRRGSEGETSPPVDEGAARENVVIAVLRRFPNNVTIRECGCRCLTNMSLLALPSSHPSAAKPDVDVAEQLVQDGAMEQVLGTMSLGSHRLSRRGQSWAATALLNLLCLSRTGIRAATRGLTLTTPAATGDGSGAGGRNLGIEAMETVAEFILGALEDPVFPPVVPISSGASTTTSAPPPGVNQKEWGAFQARKGFPAEQVAAVDAATGGLTIFLQAEAPENTKGIRQYAEMVPFVVLQAIAKTLRVSSALMVRDGRNAGVPSSVLPKQREGHPVLLGSCPSHQAAAILALLPLLHKAWMAAQVCCRHRPNLPLLHEALRSLPSSKNSTAAAAKTTANERAAPAPLNGLMEAALFLLTELEGLETMGPLQSSLLQVHREICDAVLEVMAVWTAPSVSSTAADSDKRATTGDADWCGVEDSWMKEALCAGSVSAMALATAVRVHTEAMALRSERAMNPSPLDSSFVTAPGVPLGYAPTSHTLLTRALQVLQHTALIGLPSSSSKETAASSNPTGTLLPDDVAVSANTLAALQRFLQHGVEVFQDIASATPKTTTNATAEELSELGRLFLPLRKEERDNLHRASGAATSEETPEAKRLRRLEAQSLVFLQEAALLGQICSVLYAILRHEEGAKLLLQQISAPISGSAPATGDRRVLDGDSLLTLLEALQHCLKESYGKAWQEAKAWVRHQSDLEATIVPERLSNEFHQQQHHKDVEMALGTRVEETMKCLDEMSEKLLTSVKMLVELQASATPSKRSS